MPTVIMCSLT